MAWSVKFGWHEPVGQFTRKKDAQDMAKRMREANRQAGLSGSVKVVKTASNSARRKNPTKAQKREKAAKTAAKRRVAVALAKFLKQANPAMKTAGATVTRLKGGGFTIRPIKAAKRGRR